MNSIRFSALQSCGVETTARLRRLQDCWPDLREQLLADPGIDRLNLGPVPTTRVDWNQPHEGNLFEFLYARRAIQEAAR